MAAPSSTPGMLHVTMQPKPDLSEDQFHEWYNNEHGPTRLRLRSIFSNGLRFRAIDSVEPTYLAVYDVPSMPLLATPTYTTLRENRSAREAEMIGQVTVNRTFLDLVSSRRSSLFAPIETLTDEEAEGIVLVSVELILKDGAPEAEAEVLRWYDEEFFELVAKVPGWLRTRVFRESPSLEGGSGGGGPPRIFALHELTRENGLGGPEHKATTASARHEDVASKWVVDARVRTFSLFYVFGPAPREFLHLSRLPTSKSFSSAVHPKLVTEASGPNAFISSFITTTSDGITIPYRLEGNPSPSAPTVAFSNSLLTPLHMWDAFVAILRAKRPDLRILRYDTRGRHAETHPWAPATLETLADDIAALLAALRIPKLHAMVGVSMGGATTLVFALRHPHLLSRFVACDFNAASSAANTAAWKDRIAVAESSDTGMRTLARATVERWFHPSTIEHKPELARAMTGMVAANDVEGFRLSCQALWDYDLKSRLGECRVPGLLVVGEGDGKGALVKAMEGFRGLIGKDGGVELRVVPGTGHLPMFENAAAFWEGVKDAL